MKVTTFYSYKGGLGRSLILAWSARALSAKGHSVVALDLDLEAPGLNFKLGLGSDADLGPGVVGLLRRFLSGEPPPESIEPWLRPVPDEENLRLLPAGPAPSAEYWQALASISWEELFFGPEPQGTRFFTWLREAIEDSANPDHLLVDARTGVTELGGAALALMADQILALLGTSPEGIYGTREVLRSVMAAPHPTESEVPRIGLVLSRMPATMAVPALQRLRRAVRAQITEDADPLSATVEVDLPLVIRSEPSLQEDETRALRQRDLRVHEDYTTVLDWLLGAEVPKDAPGLVYRPDQGLTELKETIDLLRKAAERDPHVYLPDLAASLQNLSSSLAGEGQREQALDAAREAVIVYRDLAKGLPDEYVPKLASSLSHLGIRFHEFGRREHALEATQEAVRYFRDLADKQPDAFLPHLAISLDNLGVLLSFLEREEALDVFQEANRLHRALADLQPEAFLPDLASSLSNIGIRLSDLGRPEEAMGATLEATEVYRSLAKERPDEFVPELARSLGAHGSALDTAQDPKGASRAFEEGLNLLMPYARRTPGAFQDLILSLARDLKEASEEPNSDLLDQVREIYGDDWAE